MTRNEFLFLRRAETAKTLRLLELYPEEKRDLRPSEKSRSALELILTFIGEERVNRKLLEGKAVTPEAHRNPPASIADAIGELRKAFEEFDRAVEKLNEADLQREVSFYTFKLPLHAALTIELLDHIHHRAQFTIYSRIAGARVPQIYGPSGDEP